MIKDRMSMKIVIDKKGLTLIEVIISLAIFGIISIVFLSLFTNGIIGIYSAGHRSKGEYKAQQPIEEEIRLNSGIRDIRIGLYC